jgi:hypothetical protein
MRSTTRTLLAFVFIIAAAGAANAQSRTWGVSPMGSDSSPGTEAAPFLTLQKAADVVNPGDTVIVEDGVYVGASASCGTGALPVVCVRRGGTASAWVTFQARHPGRAKIEGGNTSTHGFLFKGASYVTLSGFEIARMSSATGAAHGVMIDLGHDIVLSQLHIHDIGRVCTSTSQGLTGVFVRVPHVTITRSVFHDIGRFLPGENGCTASTTAHFDHAIYVSGEYYSSTTPGASDTLITNNIFYRIQRGWSVHLYPGTLPRMSILNNTFAFANTPAEDGQIIIAASTSDSRIMNNVFYSPRNAAVYYYDGTQTNLQIRNNIVYGTTKVIGAVPSGTTVSANMFTDPKVANAVSEPFDFHLLTGSPAVNAGLNLPEVTADYDGVARIDGSTDISALEFAAAPERNLDGSGASDLFLHQTETGEVNLFQMIAGVPGSVTTYAGIPIAWKPMGADDLDGNGIADLVWRETRTGDVGAWLMDASTPSGLTVKAAAVVAPAVPLGWQIVGLSDVDGDGKADFVWRHAPSGDLAVWLMNGLGVKASAVIASGIPLSWQIVGFGDVDGDHKDDFVWRQTQTGDVAFWLMNGTTVKAAPVISVGVPLSWRIAGAGDVDADGRADLIWHDAETGSVGVWLMNGASVKQFALVAAGIPLAFQIAKVADIDGDSKTDLIWRHQTSGAGDPSFDTAAWLMNGAAIKRSTFVLPAKPSGWKIY